MIESAKMAITRASCILNKFKSLQFELDQSIFELTHHRPKFLLKLLRLYCPFDHLSSFSEI